MNVHTEASLTPQHDRLEPAPASKVGVVTVTYNSGDVIDDFLRSALSQGHASFVLYIVDNASVDDTLLRIRRSPDSRIRIIQSEGNVGFAAGCNTGMRAALTEGCSHILILNNDTVFDASLVSRLLCAERDLGADLTVPKIYRFDEPNRLWAAGGRFRRLRGYASIHIGEDEIDAGQYETPSQVEFAPGCCILIRRSAIERIGYFDERFFVYTEDADYCWRAKGLGISLWYTPSVSLLHKVSSLTGGASSPFYVRYTTRNRVLFLRKHFSLITVLPWLCALQALFHWRLLFGGESWRKYCVKQRAFMEGLRLRLSP